MPRDFKITYGKNPPCVVVNFTREGMIDGETFTFYDYAQAYHFAVQFMSAMKEVWRNHDSIVRSS